MWLIYEWKDNKINDVFKLSTKNTFPSACTLHPAHTWHPLSARVALCFANTANVLKL